MKSDNLKLLMQAGNPIISLETPDEPRAVHLVREVAAAMRLPLLEWSITEGLMQPRRAGDTGLPTSVPPPRRLATLPASSGGRRMWW